MDVRGLSRANECNSFDMRGWLAGSEEPPDIALIVPPIEERIQAIVWALRPESKRSFKNSARLGAEGMIGLIFLPLHQSNQ